MSSQAERAGADRGTVPLRLKAVRATLSVMAAGFHTALPSYFTHRDLFPALVKVCPALHFEMHRAAMVLT